MQKTRDAASVVREWVTVSVEVLDEFIKVRAVSSVERAELILRVAQNVVVVLRAVEVAFDEDELGCRDLSHFIFLVHVHVRVVDDRRERLFLALA